MRGFFGRNLQRAGAVTAAASMALLGLTGVASAASGEAYASGTGVFGSANWVWTKSGFNTANVAVRDTKCDAHKVFVFFEVKRTTGQVYQTKHRENGGGCGSTASWSDLTYDAGYYVKAVRVVTCVDGGNCFRSTYQDNPLT
ncbi:hypothetical protein [Amycolatopsis keratiniphila]|uniref:hypothetical protein n=1 Tax=Amycolatopsis keratiniphila TaxID=129921 RepID=UPI00087AF3B2|nr:hypothetical protein [Amycolatopsis keratiniphila]SDU03492.1 hypothetical protein SAMN04489733_0578 [Amycolatopsis keratiniphila]